MGHPTRKRWACVVVLVCCAWTVSCKEEPKAETAAEEKAIPVRVTTLTEETVTRRMEVSGVTASDLDVTLLAEIGGRVVQDDVVLGKPVSKGTALVVVDQEPYRIAADSAKAGLAQAQAMRDQATREHERMKTLRESNDISESQYDAARFAYLQAEASLAMAQSQVAAAQRNLRLATVRAPFDGVVAAKLVKLGDTLAPGTPVAQLVNAQAMKVTAGVGEDRIGLVRVGQKAQVRFPTLNNLTLSATVSAVGAKALQPTMTYPVELHLDDVPEAVRLGMVCRVDLPYGEEMTAIRFPFESLVDRFDRRYVYLVNADKNRVEERLVELGLSLGRDAILTGGVKPGDVVVITGQANLKDGSLIQVVE